MSIWLRLKCWWYNVCPEHGPMVHHFYWQGDDWECADCIEAAKLAELQKRYAAEENRNQLFTRVQQVRRVEDV